MKKIVYVSLILLTLLSCSKDDYYDNEADKNTVSEEESNNFKEITFLLNLKYNDSSYLVVKSIDSINIFVNNSYWTKINSESIDISTVNTTTVGNKSISKNKINYLVMAEQNNLPTDFSTAGDYAAYLNEYKILQPGEYLCLIQSFQVTFNDNSVKKYYPYEYRVFKVEDNAQSVFAGEIELKIDN